ncbi:MAG: OmpA family protein [Pseudomonadota bacterium]
MNQKYWMLRLLALLALVGLAAACAGPKVPAPDADATPIADAPAEIDPALAEFIDRFIVEYEALAEFEVFQRNWNEVDLYNQKIALAAQGAPPSPDIPDNRMLDPADSTVLEAARNRLIGAFDRGGRELAGETAALTQAFFDCWVEQAEENFQAEDIATCRTGFEQLIPVLDEAANRSVVVLLPGDGDTAVVGDLGGQDIQLDTPFQAVAASDQGVDEVQLSEASVGRIFADEVAGEPEARAEFIITFESGGVILTPEGEAQLDQAVVEINRRPNADVTVLGHTDTVGPNRINVPLARTRAGFVASILEDRGVAPSFLEIDSFGESDPIVQTGDEVAEERNRRVEIVVR